MAASRNKLWAALVAFVLACGDAHGAEIDPAKAAAVIAAYVRHIAALTEWPEIGVADSDGPIRLGVVGADPNGVMVPIRLRTESGEGLTAQGRRLELVDLESKSAGDSEPEAVRACDMLFVSEDAEAEWDRLRPEVAERPVVTMSEISGFAERGGMIEFVIDVASGRVRIRVNLESMRAAGVTLSARFLGLDSVILIGPSEEAR